MKDRTVESLTRLACIIALVGLAVMALSVIYPAPLMVIFAMGAGHAIGALAFGCYLLSVVLDVARASARRSLVPPEERRASRVGDS
jgi:hypothetical protein